MTALKIFAIAAVVILLLMLLLAGSFYYKTELELKPVAVGISPDGEWELTIFQVGDPAWPFGPTDCRFDLRVGGKRVIKYPFSIHNDGVSASENNFSVTWQKDNVQVLVSAEEQYDVIYRLSFDGTVDVQKMDQNL